MEQPGTTKLLSPYTDKENESLSGLDTALNFEGISGSLMPTSSPGTAPSFNAVPTNVRAITVAPIVGNLIRKNSDSLGIRRRISPTWTTFCSPPTE